jgi:hypothetical protein
MGNGDLVSWRGAVSLFDSILGFRLGCRLPFAAISLHFWVPGGTNWRT